ncbi:MAG TPA: VWA domain-containing protein [Thermoanaerobaculia bacterium]|nr:VWA domain-containing protein [Thermoanaerobaculia bacterium]
MSLAGDARGVEAAPDLPLPSLDELAYDGVGLLVDEAQREALAAPDAGERARAVAALLADPEPATAANELMEGVRRRRALMLASSLTTTDVRARLLFLHGRPTSRQVVDCSAVFQPLEVWSYGSQRLVIYQPSPTLPYRLWAPVDGKRALYTHEMAGWLEDWEALAGRVSGKRIDRRLCELAPVVDAAVGIDGLDQELPARPDTIAWRALLDPPRDLGAWGREAAAEPLTPVETLPVEPLRVSYPRRIGLRLEARLLVELPAGAPLVPAVEKNEQGVERTELRLSVEGVVESGNQLFDTFRMRFTLAPPAGRPSPVLLAVPRPLRPGRYVMRVRVRDEVGGAEAVTARRLEVPDSPVAPPPADELGAVLNGVPGVALDEKLVAKSKSETGDDGIAIVVPPRDVVFDSVLTQAIVRGERIRKVAFLLDGQQQLARNSPPWAVHVRLPRIPRQQVLRVEGYDQQGRLVAADEVTINQLRGELDVAILAPAARSRVVGETLARAEIVVPEERKIAAVEFRVNEELQARLTRPPWEAKVSVPDGAISYLTVSAELDDGSRAEDVRILSAPEAMAEVDVDVVELYTTVTGPDGELLRGLAAHDFEVREDGRRQQLARAELVEDLPLVVGVTLDVSGSMQEALGQAQRTAADFLQNLVRPSDRCFAVAFSDRPVLVMPRTPDAAAAAQSLGRLRAEGFTALNDALVFSLYYFRGAPGRRALVVLSDGADTNSRLGFDEALAYARESAVVIYTVGLQTEALDVAARGKLHALAESTGGRSFVIRDASELAGVYQRIEAELRSQYLLGYTPDRPSSVKGFRKVEVRVTRRGATARTIAGYAP